MAVEDSVNDQAQLVAFEVNAVISDAKSVQGASSAFEFAKLVEFGMHQLLRQAAKLAKNLQL
jgi:hypothetical protein